MANAARVHAIESAKNYEGRVVIAFGGGGPVHGYRVAEKIGAHYEGILLNRMVMETKVCDAHMYSLLPSDFGLVARL